MRFRVALFLLVGLVGCEFDPTDGIDFDRGVSGFTGSLLPFTVPIELRYHDGTSFRSTARITMARIGESTRRVTGVVRGTVDKEGDRLLHTTFWEDFAFTTGRGPKGQPLWEIRQAIDQSGQVKKVEVSRSEFAKSDLELSRFEVTFFSLSPFVLPYRSTPISVGEDILGEDFGLALIGPMADDSRLGAGEEIQDSLRATARGLTFHNGRQHLVAEMSGTVAVIGSGPLTFSLKGYYLIDVETGLTSDFATFLTMTAGATSTAVTTKVESAAGSLTRSQQNIAERQHRGQGVQPPQDVRERIRELNKMLADGLISENEAAERRREILKDL